MKTISLKRDKIDVLFLLGILSITFNCFPFHLYGLGSAKALAFIFLIPYIAIYLYKNKFKLKSIPSIFKIEFIIIFLIIIISFYLSATIYHDFSGATTSISVWACYIISTLSTYFYLHKADENKIIVLSNCITKSFTIALIFGIIELISYHILKNTSLLTFLPYFVRDSMYQSSQRVQFNFGEPSYTGMLILCTLFPSYLLLKKTSYKFSFLDKCTYYLAPIVGLFTFSGTYYLLLVIYYSYLFLTKYWHKHKTIICSSIVIITISIISILNSSQLIPFLKQYESNRIAILILSKLESKSDDSSLTRTAFMDISYKAFKNRPLLGYGAGNFTIALDENIDKIDPILQTPEIWGRYKIKGIQSLSIYSTILAEFGILGIIWLFLFYKRMIIGIKGRVWLYWSLLVLVSLQSMILIVFEFIFMSIFLSNPNVNKIINR